MHGTFNSISQAGKAPNWCIRPDVAVDLWFAKDRYFGVPALHHAQVMQVTRGGDQYVQDAAGVLNLIQPNKIPRADTGVWVEEGRFQIVLWNRDLTKAEWIKNGVTAAKNQIGPDLVVNSASSITATTTNGTILNPCTNASSARASGVRVKRLSGVGTLEMTMDGGATWTVLSGITSSWLRKTIPTQTLANPSVGFRVGTNGDSFGICFVHNENGTFCLSDIETTDVVAYRPPCVITLGKLVARHLSVQSGGWVYVEAGGTPNTGSGILLNLSATNTFFVVSGTLPTILACKTNNSSRNCTLGSGSIAGLLKGCVSFAGPLLGGAVVIAGNGGVAASVNVNFSAGVLSTSVLGFGSDGGTLAPASFYNGPIKRLAIGRVGRRLAGSEVRAVTVL